jgi:hypothetical protein
MRLEEEGAQAIRVRVRVHTLAGRARVDMGADMHLLSCNKNARLFFPALEDSGVINGGFSPTLTHNSHFLSTGCCT